jgi:phage terminase small subunit
MHRAKDVSKPTKVIMSLASGSDRRNPLLHPMSTISREMIQNASHLLFGVSLVSADKHGRLAARKI